MKQIRIAFAGTVLICLATVMLLAQSSSISANVKKYIQQLPKSSKPIALSRAPYYARKDTLKVSGNVIQGNWVMGISDAGCTAPGSSTLLLSEIASLNDLTPCPKGSTLVMAVMK